MNIKQIDGDGLFEVHTVSDDVYNILCCYPIDRHGNPDPERMPRFYAQVGINGGMHKFALPSDIISLAGAISAFDSSLRHYIEELRTSHLRSQLTSPLDLSKVNGRH